MRLSTRALYGTRAVLDLALHKGQGVVTLKDIARRQEISLSYLVHLLTPLVIGGVVRSIRGPKGGFLLDKAPEKVKLSTVIRLLEGTMSLVDCVAKPKICSRSRLCVTRDVWLELQKVMDRFLESVTLQDLVERQRRRQLLHRDDVLGVGSSGNTPSRY